ncbi:MAG: 16S rRNA (guanine(527)-N(7))-methyltransferase RsmG [Acutalibacteraceae bacterium]|nr:16S rRNA (guanine(527)-N(7))-methyltransferase RsmG [Acutalibacteraceae bacterium]
MYNSSLMISDAERLGISLTDEQLSRFEKLSNLLVEQNKTMNLTAITDPDGIAVKHFADSISVLTAAEMPQGAKVLDVGTGAGFPGIPLLIMRPDLDLTMIDSTAKKLKYVENTVNELGLTATTLHTRAEEAGQSKEYREKFDFVCSRAVAALNVLCEYCLPFVKQNGLFIAMKGAKAQEEIDGAKSAIKLLGGKIIAEKSFSLSDGGERTLVVIKKISQIPPKYPRPSAQIAKKPL